jgi:hypothetical protein
LLDNARLISQLVGLERRTARSGRDSIDHAPGAKDDVVNAVAGLCAAAINKYPNYDTEYRAFQPGFVDEDAPPTPPDRMPSAAQSRLVDLYRGIAAGFGPSLPNPPTPKPLPPAPRTADGNWWKPR